MRSEAAIKAIEPRPNSPDWLVEEVQRARAGLMRLRQNVVLLRNPDDSESFYPVCGRTPNTLAGHNPVTL